MSEILIPPLFRMLAKAFQALEHEVANHVERIEVLEAEKREGHAYIEKLRGEIEAAKTGAHLGAEERAVLEATLGLVREVEKRATTVVLFKWEWERLRTAVQAWRATGRSL
jgi:hypothetical protein